MARLVVPSIVRCLAVGRTLDDRWACVTDLYVTDGDSFGFPPNDRASQIRQATDRLWDAWAMLFEELSTTCFLDAILWTDLDLANGTTGEKIGTNSNPNVIQGGSSSDPMPSNIALVASKVEELSRRGVRSGRMFIPGVRESMADGNVLNASSLAAVQDKLDDFVAEVNHTPTVDNSALSELRTVHVPRSGDPFSSKVTKLQLRQRVSHQDRRINRY